MVDPGTVVAAIATGVVFILIGIIFFVVGALAESFKKSKTAPAGKDSVPRCTRCGALMTPLLDSSHKFLGEAVCSRGHMATGVLWPARDVPPA